MGARGDSPITPPVEPGPDLPYAVPETEIGARLGLYIFFISNNYWIFYVYIYLLHSLRFLLNDLTKLCEHFKIIT